MTVWLYADKGPVDRKIDAIGERLAGGCPSQQGDALTVEHQAPSALTLAACPPSHVHLWVAGFMHLGDVSHSFLRVSTFQTLSFNSYSF